jgi:hypothetical protein
VPPLATVGICLELGRPSDALGALTLFLTNFSAIVVVACIVFVIFGNAPSITQMRERHRLRNGFLLAVVMLIIVAIPLMKSSLEEARTIILSNEGAPVVEAWVGDRNLEVVRWSISGELVTVDVAGTEPPAPAASLAATLAATFGQPVQVVVNYSPVQQEQAAAP